MRRQSWRFSRSNRWIGESARKHKRTMVAAPRTAKGQPGFRAGGCRFPLHLGRRAALFPEQLHPDCLREGSKSVSELWATGSRKLPRRAQFRVGRRTARPWRGLGLRARWQLHGPGGCFSCLEGGQPATPTEAIRVPPGGADFRGEGPGTFIDTSRIIRPRGGGGEAAALIREGGLTRIRRTCVMLRDQGWP